MEYSVQKQTSVPVGNWRDVRPLVRQWALVKKNRGIGYTVVSRYATKEAAERAMTKYINAA